MRQSIHVDIDKSSNEKDFNGEDNDNDKEMTNVGSNGINTNGP